MNWNNPELIVFIQKEFLHNNEDKPYHLAFPFQTDMSEGQSRVVSELFNGKVSKMRSGFCQTWSFPCVITFVNELTVLTGWWLLHGMWCLWWRVPVQHIVSGEGTQMDGNIGGSISFELLPYDKKEQEIYPSPCLSGNTAGTKKCRSPAIFLLWNALVCESLCCKFFSSLHTALHHTETKWPISSGDWHSSELHCAMFLTTINTGSCKEENNRLLVSGFGRSRAGSAEDCSFWCSPDKGDICGVHSAWEQQKHLRISLLQRISTTCEGVQKRFNICEQSILLQAIHWLVMLTENKCWCCSVVLSENSYGTHGDLNIFAKVCQHTLICAHHLWTTEPE